MKDQYYADSRDVAKWTVLVRLARDHDLDTIIQIAMLTPNDRSAHGHQTNDPQNSDSAVAQFFAEERDAFSTCHSLKQIDRIARLGDRYLPPITIKVISDLFMNDRRKSYFDAVCKWISNADRPVVALVDPDTGISIGRPSARHITESELNAIWSELMPGSVLTTFQYQQRRRDWVNDARQHFAFALQTDVGNVGDYTYTAVHVTFLFARKRESESWY